MKTKTETQFSKPKRKTEMLDCEICGKQTDVEPKHCCNGNNCSCGGLPVNEGLIVCSDCKDVLIYINNISKSKKHHSSRLCLSELTFDERTIKEFCFDQIEE